MRLAPLLRQQVAAQVEDGQLSFERRILRARRTLGEPAQSETHRLARDPAAGCAGVLKLDAICVAQVKLVDRLLGRYRRSLRYGLRAGQYMARADFTNVGKVDGSKERP